MLLCIDKHRLRFLGTLRDGREVYYVDGRDDEPHLTLSTKPGRDFEHFKDRSKPILRKKGIRVNSGGAIKFESRK